MTLVLFLSLAFSVYLSMSKPLIGRLASVLFTSLAMSVSSVLVFSHGFFSIELATVNMTSMGWFYSQCLVL